MGEEWFIGVDGGGSKTRLVLADGRGVILHQGLSGPTNHQSTSGSFENFVELLRPVRLLADSYREQGRLPRIVSMDFALSGWDFPGDREILTRHTDRALAELELAPVILNRDNDIFAVLSAGLSQDPSGICLIAGAGVLGAALSPRFSCRTWGLDYRSGEWGSGTNLGEEALHRVLSSAQGREEPCPLLTLRALEFWKVSGPEALAELAGSSRFDPSSFTRFAVELFAAHAGGCPGAADVLRKGGEAHARTVAALQKRLDNPFVPLVLGGGVFQHNGLLPGFTENLSRFGRLPSEIRILKSDPVWGSLLRAFRAAERESPALPFLKNIDLERRIP